MTVSTWIAMAQTVVDYYDELATRLILFGEKCMTSSSTIRPDACILECIQPTIDRPDILRWTKNMERPENEAEFRNEKKNDFSVRNDVGNGHTRQWISPAHIILSLCPRVCVCVSVCRCECVCWRQESRANVPDKWARVHTRRVRFDNYYLII